MEARIEKTSVLLIILYVMVYSASYVASDIYFPALPIMAEYFNAAPHMIQYTLSTYMLGLAVGQLFYGSSSDIYGRKKTLLVGFSCFSFFSLLLLVENNLTVFIITRFFQAVSAASGAAVIRAYIYDRYGAKGSAEVFGIVLPIVSISPALVPPIGGLICYFFSWKILFLLLFVYALILVFFIKFGLKNIVFTGTKRSMNFFKDFYNMIRSINFCKYGLLPCITFFIYFAYIVESPFILSSHGYGSVMIGFSYVTFSAGYLLGSFIAKRLNNYMKNNHILMLGYILFFIGGLGMVFASCLFKFSLIGLVIPMTITTLGNGFVMPISFSQVMGSFPDKAGAASSLTGFVQLLVAFLSTAIIHWITLGEVLNLSVLILSVTSFGLIAFFCLFKGQLSWK